MRPPANVEIAVDIALAHRVTDVVEAAPAGVEERQGGVPAEVGDELGQHVVPAVHPAAVAAAGAGAAVLALDEHDVRVRGETLDREGRPETREAAADDAHVGAFGGGQRHHLARLPAWVAALPVDGRACRIAGPLLCPALLIRHAPSPSRRLAGARAGGSLTSACRCSAVPAAQAR